MSGPETVLAAAKHDEVRQREIHGKARADRQQLADQHRAVGVKSGDPLQPIRDDIDGRGIGEKPATCASAKPK